MATIQEASLTVEEAAEMFSITVRTVQRITRRNREGGQTDGQA